MGKGASEFDRNIRRLADEVGAGSITARATVDQPYAQDQHQTRYYRHANGGRAGYLFDPMVENVAADLQEIANRVVVPSGSEIVAAMVDYSEKQSKYVENNAPKDQHLLRFSTTPQVLDGGKMVYTRPPLVNRDNTKNTGNPARAYGRDDD